jgi:exodeoxyribonuclease V gamma subunit
MFVHAETPRALLERMSEALSQIRDPHARHWLVMPKRGRAEYVIRRWADLAGVAAHTQEVQLRELLEQAASGDGPRFDFEQLRLAIASALPELCGHGDSPVPKGVPLEPVSPAVLDWAASIARAIDEALFCRTETERWNRGSFLEAVAAHPSVSASLKAHVGCIAPIEFEQNAARWMELWLRRGGIPYLWIQMDAGLPVIQLEKLNRLLEILSHSHAARIHLFALSPSAEYWGECQLRKRKRVAGEPVEPDPEFHPGSLLWAFGRCSQDLHRQLAESLFAFGDGGQHVASRPTPNSLLGALQRSCRKAAPMEPHEMHAILPEDASLTVHAARSTLRELENCRDRILQAMHELPDLRYEEILILLADPKRQAPFVEAGLRTGNGAQHCLPFRLLGFGQAVPSPFAEALSILVRKIRGRLNLEDVQVLMENPLIAARFGFAESADSGKRIIGWLRDAGFRWGTNAHHRSEHQPIVESRWNLFWAIQRLGLGAVSASASSAQAQQLPGAQSATVPLDRASGLSVQELAQLASFASSLERARVLWTQPEAKPVAEWNAGIKMLAHDFLDCSEPGPAQHCTKLLNTILPALARAATAAESELNAEGYLRLLEEKLKTIGESGARGPGGILVADLREYAGVPSRMILIAGLDSETFPRREERPFWHPLSASRKTGDPSLREADRHAILLGIMACEERLVLSYQGGSDEDAKERPPSTALADLLQAIDSCVAVPERGCAMLPHEHIVFRHPLNGFSPAAFHPERPTSARGHLEGDFNAAGALAARRGLPAFRGPWQHPLPLERIEDGACIALQSLRTLLSKPLQLFLRRLGAVLPSKEDMLASGDLLDLDGLKKWRIRDDLLAAKLEGNSIESLKAKFAVAGDIPRGALGDAMVEELLDDTPDAPTPALTCGDRITCLLQTEVTHPLRPDERCVIAGELRSGWYRSGTAGVAFYYSASKTSLEKQLLFLVEALLLAAHACTEPSNNISHAAEHGAAERLFHTAEARFSGKRIERIQLPEPRLARTLLGALLPLFEAAKSLPLPLWAESLDKIWKHQRPVAELAPEQIRAALEIGRETWEGNQFSGGLAAADAPETQYAFRGCENPFLWAPRSDAIDFLPHPETPIAWRVSAYLHTWKETLENVR